MASGRSIMKIEGSGSASGSISQMHGSADPDPHQNVMDPQHCWQLSVPVYEVHRSRHNEKRSYNEKPMSTLHEKQSVMRSVGHCRYHDIIMKLYKRVNISDPSSTAITIRVGNPHWFTADPDTDPDPAFFLIADQHPDPGYDDLKLRKKIIAVNLIFIFLIKNCNFLIPQATGDAFSPQKRTSST